MNQLYMLPHVMPFSQTKPFAYEFLSIASGREN
jgi:hypothetical protein